MKTLKRVVVALLMATLCSSAAYAQSDAELWLEGTLQFEPVDDLRVSITQHLRFNDDMSRLDKAMPELALGWRGHRSIRPEVGYRFIAEHRPDEWRIHHRPYAQLTLRHSIDDVVLSLRVRSQHTLVEKKKSHLWEHVLRNRARVSWEFADDWEVNGDAELFALASEEERFHASRWRLGVGLAREFDDHTVQIGYQVRSSIGRTPVSTRHILTLGYEFDI